MHGCLDALIPGSMDTWMRGWMKGYVYICMHECMHACVYISICARVYLKKSMKSTRLFRIDNRVHTLPLAFLSNSSRSRLKCCSCRSAWARSRSWLSLLQSRSASVAVHHSPNKRNGENASNLFQYIPLSIAISRSSAYARPILPMPQCSQDTDNFR